ncbi:MULTISPECIES: dihydroneopterin aldolase [Salimicrobium]|uniref:7,8-dihydroneopterin aldolase n=1 Tax=Salimicrobium humidisoli TaxID=2029857 RepID=A0ABX4HNX4_9BACI|nr:MULTISPECIES: dihydroneopterin aldolase [Salimicrobium]PBB04896.1 dihydroneopterin aldolase [Salimicrobium humidisoli]
MDKIYLNSMKFYGYHGVFPEENKLGQHFTVDLQLEAELKEAASTDDVSKSIDYGAVHEVTKEIVEGPARNLVETVAEEIAGKLFAEFAMLEACQVRVNKLHPPIPGHYDSVSIEIYRSRD